MQNRLAPIALAVFILSLAACAQNTAYRIEPIDRAFAEKYGLDRAFYKKHTSVQGIEIISSERVSDIAHREAGFLIEKQMANLRPDVARRIREADVLYFIIGNNELSSQVPEMRTDATGDQLDYYNWRARGMKTQWRGRTVVISAEEDLLEYEGGMRNESIFIHEFAHLIHGEGFDKKLNERLNQTYRVALDRHLWQDARPAQRFRRITGPQPVALLDALDRSFEDCSRAFFRRCFADGRILVNGSPAEETVKVTAEDKVLILYDGPKTAYAGKNRAEYWAEIAQAWYDTNRVHDHDHNHVDTREELLLYDPIGAALCAEVLGHDAWRFVSPRQRAGKGHLKGYDPNTAPKHIQSDAIKDAANDYYDKYWKPYRDRLKQRYADDG